jgi:hypothetical protein
LGVIIPRSRLKLCSAKNYGNVELQQLYNKFRAQVIEHSDTLGRSPKRIGCCERRTLSINRHVRYSLEPTNLRSQCEGQGSNPSAPPIFLVFITYNRQSKKSRIHCFLSLPT